MFVKFINDFSDSDQLREKYQATYWDKANLARSTFLRVHTSNDQVRIEVFRDDARGGEYSLLHSQILN